MGVEVEMEVEMEVEGGGGGGREGGRESKWGCRRGVCTCVHEVSGLVGNAAFVFHYITVHVRKGTCQMQAPINNILIMHFY